MAKRPFFYVTKNLPYSYSERNIEFEWFPGFAISQKQKSIASFHSNIEQLGFGPVIEISSKSTEPIGVRLSAFNLMLKLAEGITSSVESIYQGSKVFEGGGPYVDIFLLNSREARKDSRLSASGKLIGFKFRDEIWDLYPTSAFYDWVYLNALYRNKELFQKLLEYNSFTDIEFNPSRQFSCQARTASIAKCFYLNNVLEIALSDKQKFIEKHAEYNGEKTIL